MDWKERQGYMAQIFRIKDRREFIVSEISTSDLGHPRL